MGAVSMDLPAIFVPCGPMIPGNLRGEVLGSGTDVWRYWADKRGRVETVRRGMQGPVEATAIAARQSPKRCLRVQWTRSR
jgi:dihydroxyacid dehydratase/phosphogluconate dehydratase